MNVACLLEDPGRTFIFNEQSKNRLAEIFSADPKLHCWGDVKLFYPGLENARNNLDAFIAILNNYKNHFKPGAEYILFKGERIVFLVKKILKARTNHTIQFISLIRDPRAVFASQKRTSFPGTQLIMSNDPIKTADYWKRNVRLSHFFRAENFLIIRFEDLIMNNSSSLHILSEFLKLNLNELSPDKGDLLKRMSDVQIKIHENIKKMPMIQKIDEWQKELTSSEIYIIERISDKFLIDSGYIRIKSDHYGINIFINMRCKLLKLSVIRLFKKISFHFSRILAGS